MQAQTIIRSLVVINGLCAFAGAVSAPSVPREVLILGNSFTYVNDLDICINNLSSNADPEVNMHFERRASGGWTLKNHFESQDEMNAVRSGEWDYVVLQGQSREPISNESQFFQYAREIDKVVKEAGSKTAFFMTWAYNDQPEMYDPMASAYERIAAELDALVIPCGRAHQRVLEERSDINLYQDYGHPTVPATYLLACVFFSVFTGESAEGNGHTFGQDNNTASYLQKTAFEVASEYENPSAAPQTQAIPVSRSGVLRPCTPNAFMTVSGIGYPAAFNGGFKLNGRKIADTNRGVTSGMIVRLP
jgi:hypothetical protein